MLFWSIDILSSSSYFSFYFVSGRQDSNWVGREKVSRSFESCCYEFFKWKDFFHLRSFRAFKMEKRNKFSLLISDCDVITFVGVIFYDFKNTLASLWIKLKTEISAPTTTKWPCLIHFQYCPLHIIFYANKLNIIYSISSSIKC